jgi:U3 small nucleolar RNA-associated protein 11
MGLLENSKKRKAHKERAQPKERLHLGRLEKKKDYKERAINYQRKQAHLTQLKRKARDRNPDEFVHAMQRQRTRNGVHDTRPRPRQSLYNDDALLLKTNDHKYLLSAAQTERHKVHKLESTLHGISSNQSTNIIAPKQHLKFVHDDNEASHDTTSAAEPSTSADPANDARLARRIARRYRELEQRKERLKRLSRLTQNLEQQRALMVRTL